MIFTNYTFVSDEHVKCLLCIILRTSNDYCQYKTYSNYSNKIITFLYDIKQHNLQRGMSHIKT